MRRLAIALATIAAVGCSSSDDDFVIVEPPVTPPMAMQTSFVTFVDSAVRQDEDATPLEVDDDELIFDAEDDPTAFDALLAEFDDPT